MTPRQHCLDCVQKNPPALLEAALWIAAEHDPSRVPADALQVFDHLLREVAAGLPEAPPAELAQPLLRRMAELGFCEEDDQPLQPRAALLDQVLARRRGQPLSLALVAQALAARLEIPLAGVNFPGHFLVRVPAADHLLDPCTGRRLYPRDCRELLLRTLGPKAELLAEHMRPCSALEQLQRLSRNLRQLHLQAEQVEEALKDAERVLELGPANLIDHLARADIYKQLECPQAERYDLERALLLCEDATQRLLLSRRLEQLGAPPRLH